MDTAVSEITWSGLAVAFVPAFIAIGILWRWSAGAGTALYATARMLAQLLLIGYVLVFIFASDDPFVIVGVLLFMLLVSAWIAIRPLHTKNARAYLCALVAITVGGVLTLVLVTRGVLAVQPWFSPRHLVPLAGMIFAGAMNAISLAAERYQAETGAAGDDPPRKCDLRPGRAGCSPMGARAAPNDRPPDRSMAHHSGRKGPHRGRHRRR